MSTRFSEIADEMTNENLLALAERMDDYADADSRGSVWSGRLQDYRVCAEILRRSVVRNVIYKCEFEERDGQAFCRTHGFVHGKSAQSEESGRGQWDRPEHYGGEENPFEPIKIIEHYDLNFNLGNVVKYVLRAPFKGTALKDLKKAYTYIGFEIRRRERAGETE